MKNISIVGYYGYGNCGDEALKSAMSKIFDGHASLSFTTPDSTVPIENVVLGGGDVVNPYFLQRISGQSDVKILGAGLGYVSQLDLLLEQGNVTEAFFRNKADVEIAKTKGMNAKYTPDLAFAMDLPTPTLKATDGKKTLGIMVADNISASYTQKDPQQTAYGSYLKNELALTLNDLRDYYNVVFIPMSHARYAYDVKMAYEILSQIPSSSELNYTVAPHAMSPETALQTVAGVDLLITMRFHGLIFASLAGVPAINVGVTRKTHTFMQENALADLSLEPFSLTKDQLLAAVKTAEDPLTKTRMEQCRDVNRQALQQVISYVRTNWC